MRRLRDSRGAVGLTICLIAVIFLTIISTTAVLTLRSMKRETLYQAMLIEAQGLADSGAQDAMKQISGNASWKAGFSQKPLMGGYYTVLVSTDQRPWIVSTGYAKPLALLGRAFKTVQFKLEVMPIPYVYYGLMAGSSMIFQGNAYTDTYNSDVDPGASNPGASAAVWSNGTLTTNQSNYTVYGDAYYFTIPAPAAGTVSATVTHSTYTQTIPTQPNTGFDTENDNTTGLVPQSYYNAATKAVSIPSGQTAIIYSGIYYFSSMTIGGTLDAAITNGPVIVYLTGNFTMTGSHRVTGNRTPGNFIVYGPNSGAQTYNITSSRKFYGIIQAPKAAVTINMEFFGAIAANTITLQSGSALHQDVTLLNPAVNDVMVTPGTWQTTVVRH